MRPQRVGECLLLEQAMQDVAAYRITKAVIDPHN
jgi:hypothetical protein